MAKKKATGAGLPAVNVESGVRIQVTSSDITNMLMENRANELKAEISEIERQIVGLKADGAKIAEEHEPRLLELAREERDSIVPLVKAIADYAGETMPDEEIPYSVRIELDMYEGGNEGPRVYVRCCIGEANASVPGAPNSGRKNVYPQPWHPAEIWDTEDLSRTVIRLSLLIAELIPHYLAKQYPRAGLVTMVDRCRLADQPEVREICDKIREAVKPLYEQIRGLEKQKKERQELLNNRKELEKQIAAHITAAEISRNAELRDHVKSIAASLRSADGNFLPQVE